MDMKVKKVDKGFPDPKTGEFIQVLEDVNLKIEKGKFYCLMGPSGCGKSTLLHIMAGILRQDKGKVMMGGKTIKGPSPKLGVIFQEPSIFPWMTVKQNVEFGLKVAGFPRNARSERAQQYLNLVALKGFDDHRPHEISGGMKQKVAIARALAMDPQIMLMDEPFCSLDEQTRRKLDASLVEIHHRSNKTTVFVTHNIEEALLLADEIIMLSMRPATVKNVIKVALNHPRDPYDKLFLMMKKNIASEIDRCCFECATPDFPCSCQEVNLEGQ